MPKLPQISGKKLVKILKKMGFEVVSQKGSHIKLVNDRNQTVVVPNHKVIKKGTLKKGILNPLDISVKELIAAMKK